MDRNRIITNLVPDIKQFNPACLDFTEQEARDKGLWTDERPMPTPEQVTAEDIQIKAHDLVTEYIGKRQEEYPSITEQMDMLYWDTVNGTNVWRTKIEEIKTKYPKPL